MADIHSSVMPALRLRGSLKAVMPLEMASTPVSAVVPLEKACSSRNSVTAWPSPWAKSGGGLLTWPSWPRAWRAKPMPTVTTIMTRKK